MLPRRHRQSRRLQLRKDLYDLNNVPDNLYDFFRSRPLEYEPPEEIADVCFETRAARLPLMEQAMENSSCSLKAWVPDPQDIDDEERIILSR